MDEVLEKLREFKNNQEAIIDNEEEKIIDVSFYGKINLSKNDADMNNEKEEELYLVKREINGKTILEFTTNKGILAKVNEEGEIKISEGYKELINEKEFLLQLQKVVPLSLEELEEIQKRKQSQIEKVAFANNKQKNQTEEMQDEHQYKENSKDVKIDLNKKITETKTFSDLVPEVKEKGIVDVRVRRITNSEFEFIGINNKGEEIKMQTLMQTQGTNPSKEIIEVNKDGSQVKKEQVMTMLKIVNGQDQGKQNEGFTVDLDQYGIPKVNYYRRSSEENEYTSIPVNLENTDQKITDLDVRQYLEKKRNPSIQDNIKRAKDRIDQNETHETELENIDDDLNNDKVVDSSEILIKKAAKRCKIPLASFKKELEKADGNTLEEKIQNTEEEINDQFRGNMDRRA